ncbi:helix-turn-helix domain-containing protein [Pelagibius sp. Alg239-R121]|uniref:MerR family transcriptional regulator n=1 Tax=Pelagibius sp. Alg239-R121 TaxID=2993448 RepID=UPI0024A7353A|nr:helix-turn-helix domain-containing protein [Pelagibius sp. Alg239-R121]
MQHIGEAAKLSGVNIETIRYYEREGIVPTAERTASGRRLYDDAAIARLRFVRRCRDLGFPIADIRTLLGLSSNASKPCSEVKEISQRHLDDVRARLSDLQNLEAALVDLVHECASARSECPALKQLFAD